MSSYGEVAEPTEAGPAEIGRPTTGVEPPEPEDHAGERIAVIRSFAFVDITGFTHYCDSHGEHAAIALLTRFRTHVRDISARRGVRVAKWLGDGVMLVSVSEGPIVATVTELVMRCDSLGLHTHAGICTGTVLMFEGDDYVGRPANLAARLCDRAEPGQVLAAHLTDELPSWVDDAGPLRVAIVGVGDLDPVHDLRVAPEVAARLRAGHAAA